MVAALRVVDYVVIADYGDLDRLVEALKPVEYMRLEADMRSAATAGASS